MYGLLKSLMCPFLPQNRLSDLIKLLNNNFNPKTSEVVERYKFRKCVHSEENVTD